MAQELLDRCSSRTFNRAMAEIPRPKLTGEGGLQFPNFQPGNGGLLFSRRPLKKPVAVPELSTGQWRSPLHLAMSKQPRAGCSSRTFNRAMAGGRTKLGLAGHSLQFPNFQPGNGGRMCPWFNLPKTVAVPELSTGQWRFARVLAASSLETLQFPNFQPGNGGVVFNPRTEQEELQFPNFQPGNGGF